MTLAAAAAATLQCHCSLSFLNEKRYSEFPDFTYKMITQQNSWNGNWGDPHWCHARPVRTMQFRQQQQNVFPTQNMSGLGGREARMKQLWQEFFADPSQWWDYRLTKKTSQHPDFKHKTTLEALWIDSWLNPPWVKEKLSIMGLDLVHSSTTLGLRTPSFFAQADKLKKLCEEGRLKDALHIMKILVKQSVKVPVGAYVCLLKGCAQRKALAEGKQVHALIVQTKCDSNIYLANNLIHMYSKCDSVSDAHKVFSTLSHPNVFSWTAIISAYADRGQCEQAIFLFQQMQETGTEPDKVACIVVLKVCAKIADLNQGKQLHSLILKRGFESDVILQNTLVDMYAKCGCLEDARELFNNMTERDEVSWNTMIAGYVQKGLGKEALALYEQMKEEGVQPNEITFLVILQACASVAALELGKQLHALIIRRGFGSDVVLQTALVDMYAKCRCLEDALELFNSMTTLNIASWNVMIAGYADNGRGKDALALYEKMTEAGVQPNTVTFVLTLKACASTSALEQGKQLHSQILKRGFQSNVTVQNALVDMYAKCGCLEDAHKLFNNITERDVVSWTTIIAGYVQNGLGKQALALYAQMKLEGVQPNKVTYLVALQACASIGALEQGKQLHSLTVEKGFDSDVALQTAIIVMYVKCGCLDNALKLFNNMTERNVVSWSAMIAGYAQNGLGKEAVALYEQMKQAVVQPNEVTYTCILLACSHSGLVDEGFQVFDSMCKVDGKIPALEHYACMVDLLGRAGCLASAENFIMKMPIEPDGVVWMSLLDAARNHGHVEVGQRAFDCIMKLQPENGAAYLLLIDIYSAAGRMDEVAKLRKEMKDKGLKKVPDCSWIEVDNQVYALASGGINRSQSQQPGAELGRLIGLTQMSACNTDFSSDLIRYSACK